MPLAWAGVDPLYFSAPFAVVAASLWLGDLLGRRAARDSRDAAAKHRYHQVSETCAVLGVVAGLASSLVTIALGAPRPLWVPLVVFPLMLACLSFGVQLFVERVRFNMTAAPPTPETESYFERDYRARVQRLRIGISLTAIAFSASALFFGHVAIPLVIATQALAAGVNLGTERLFFPSEWRRYDGPRFDAVLELEAKGIARELEVRLHRVRVVPLPGIGVSYERGLLRVTPELKKLPEDERRFALACGLAAETGGFRFPLGLAGLGVLMIVLGTWLVIRYLEAALLLLLGGTLIVAAMVAARRAREGRAVEAFGKVVAVVSSTESAMAFLDRMAGTNPAAAEEASRLRSTLTGAPVPSGGGAERSF